VLVSGGVETVDDKMVGVAAVRALVAEDADAEELLAASVEEATEGEAAATDAQA